MIFKAVLIFFLALVPFGVNAQKAYETANYSGRLKGQTITLKLANGYIGASEIARRSSPKARPIVYTPDSGTPDKDNKITFRSIKATAGYFIVKNMQEAYDELPVIIYAVFITGQQSIPIKLTRHRSNI